MREFLEQIKSMNRMYKLPVHGIPMLPKDPADRLIKFKKTLSDEIDEIDQIVETIETLPEVGDTQVMTMIADLLGDVVVYCFSEALKYGIPMKDILGIIMESNASKLGADGKPIYNAEGKFLKGPNYFPPEPAIKKRLRAGCGVQRGEWS